jgi:hypothetical protein
VLAYGREVFVTGLTEGSTDGTLFEATCVNSIRNGLSQGQAFVNVFDAYRQFREQSELAETHRQLPQIIREQEPSWFNSHTTFSERLEAVWRFPESHAALDKNSAIDLLSESAEVEWQLTEMLTDHIHFTF